MAPTSAASVLTSLGAATEHVAAEEDRDAVLDRLSRPEQPTLVAFVNAHGCNLAVGSMQLQQDLLDADVLLRDGSGMAMLCRRMGLDPGVNMNGTDLIPALIERYSGRPVALIGTTDPWLSSAAEHVSEKAPVVVIQDGFADEHEYVERLRGHPAELIVLAMGMPRQERIGTCLREALDHPCLIVCGGAVLDFLGGRVERAPRWMRKIGIEWVWRLALEPRRLSRRYLAGNAMFMARLAAIQWKRRRTATAQPEMVPRMQDAA
jgi:N-acetylglucosaminyldiphosphoundecaprenol N-acetyl-beta-D-mannosaminyltransferase